jgi:hypothetical protein
VLIGLSGLIRLGLLNLSKNFAPIRH